MRFESKLLDRNEIGGGEKRNTTVSPHLPLPPHLVIVSIVIGRESLALKGCARASWPCGKADLSVKPVRQIESRVKRRGKKSNGSRIPRRRERERGRRKKGAHGLPLLYAIGRVISGRSRSKLASVRSCSVYVGGKLEELSKRSQTAAEFAPLEANRVVRLCLASSSAIFQFPPIFLESCSFDVFTVFLLLSLSFTHSLSRYRRGCLPKLQRRVETETKWKSSRVYFRLVEPNDYNS